MIAVGLFRPGGPEVLELVELSAPEPGRGETRVRVAAATVNPADVLLRRGELPAVTGPLPHVPGLEFAGVVERAGPGSAWSPGDMVAGARSFTPSGRGAQAEFAVATDDRLVRVPRGVTLAEAATLPMNGLTAIAALDALRLPQGGTVLVTGAAGAVGGYATQLAAAAGHRVIAVAALDDVELVRGFGADLVVARGTQSAAAVLDAVPGGVDGAVDGALIAAEIQPAVRDGGRIAVLRDLELAPERGIAAARINVGTIPSAHDWLVRLVEAVDDGQLTLRVAHELPAAQAAEAHRLIERPGSGARGRIVLTF